MLFKSKWFEKLQKDSLIWVHLVFEELSISFHFKFPFFDVLLPHKDNFEKNSQEEIKGFPKIDDCGN